MKKLDTTLTEREALLHRKDDCCNYDRCLDKAAIKSWRSFSCIGCSEYKQDRHQFMPRLRKSSPLAGELL
ncbi:MAG: hypothetical protein JXR76_05380 [Deltaproteobacteria bacterium]|nr:hypothetical protein [Deltaproteobacteria bacterium]